MKINYIKKGLIVILMIIPIFIIYETDFLVNKNMKKDPLKQDVNILKKDTYNQYGLPNKDKLSEEILIDNKQVVVYSDRILNKIKINKSNISRTKKYLLKLTKKISNKTPVYMMAIPNSIVYDNNQKNQKELYFKFCESIQRILPKKVKFIDIYNELENKSDEYIFFRTENSWTARGAFYGAKKFCDEINIKSYDLKNYNEYMFMDFIGTSYSHVANKYTFIKKYKENIYKDPLYLYILPGGKNRETIEKWNHQKKKNEIYKQPTVAKSRMELSAFVGNSYNWAEIDGDKKDKSKSNKTLLLICDNNGKILAPFLSSYYKNVVVINTEADRFSSKKFNKIFKKYNISEVLVAQNIQQIGDITHNKFFEELGE